MSVLVMVSGVSDLRLRDAALALDREVKVILGEFHGRSLSLRLDDHTVIRHPELLLTCD